jgi:hypothetical protein
LLVAGKGVGLEVNADKSNYMFMSCEEDVGQNWNIKIGKLSFENVEQFQYFGTALK